MPLLADLQQVLASQDVAPAAPQAAEPDVAEAASGELQTEGAVPDVAETGEIVDPGATASEQAFGDKPTADSGQLDGGMYEVEEYQAACQAAGTPDKWDDRYVHGHTAAAGWVQPYEGRYDMTFTLKPGESASQAVKDFLKGPTIADYRVIGVAYEMEELRDDLGDQRFDQLFGSRNAGEDAKIPPGERLKITSGMYTIPFRAQMMALANERDAAPPTEEPEAPQIAAQIEDKPQVSGISSEPAPEMVADELGIERERELA